LDLNGVVLIADALHALRVNLNWLVKAKKAHYIAIVKRKPAVAARTGQGPAVDGRYQPALRSARPGTTAPRSAA
jgi:hypothetical protein